MTYYHYHIHAPFHSYTSYIYNIINITSIPVVERSRPKSVDVITKIYQGYVMETKYRHTTRITSAIFSDFLEDGYSYVCFFLL